MMYGDTDRLLTVYGIVIRLYWSLVIPSSVNMFASVPWFIIRAFEAYVVGQGNALVIDPKGACCRDQVSLRCSRQSFS